MSPDVVCSSIFPPPAARIVRTPWLTSRPLNRNSSLLRLVWQSFCCVYFEQKEEYLSTVDGARDMDHLQTLTDTECERFSWSPPPTTPDPSRPPPIFLDHPETINYIMCMQAVSFSMSELKISEGWSQIEYIATLLILFMKLNGFLKHFWSWQSQKSGHPLYHLHPLLQ